MSKRAKIDTKALEELSVELQTCSFGGSIGSEKPKNGSARFTKPFLNLSSFVCPAMICSDASSAIEETSKVEQEEIEPSYIREGRPNLVELERNQTGHKRGRRCNGGNNLTRNQLGLRQS